jgi:surfactin synthase thioesterase subunit
MTWKMAQTLPRCEAHFVPGGHFVAITISDQIIARLKQHLDAAPGALRTTDRSAR